MDKQELEKYKKEIDRFSGDVGEVDAHVLADIACQLTRIADRLDSWNSVSKDSEGNPVNSLSTLKWLRVKR